MTKNLIAQKIMPILRGRVHAHINQRSTAGSNATKKAANVRRIGSIDA